MTGICKKKPEINVTGRYLVRKISNLKKKAQRYQNEQNIFVFFGFVPYVDQLKVV